MAKSIITKIFGAILIFMGALFAIVAFVPESDGSYDIGFVLFALVLGVLFVVPGILIIRWGSRRPEPNPYMPGTYPGQQPVANPTQVAPVVAPVPAPVVAPAPAPGAAPSAPSPSRPDSLERLLARSNDLYPSLKDLVRHDLQVNRESDASHAAAVLLSDGGILDWSPTPKASITKLSRTGKFWTNFPSDGISVDDYHRVVSAEASLNVAAAIASQGVTSASSDADIVAFAKGRLLSSLDAPLPAWDPTGDLSLAYPGTQPQDTPGEWLERMGVSFYAENYPADIRIVYDLASDVSAGTSCISVELPAGEVFAPYAADDAGRAALARTYSLRLCLLMARMAFSACQRVSRVVVNGHLYGSDATVLSVDLDRAALDRIFPAVASDAVTNGGFPQDPSISARFDTLGRLEEVSPSLTLRDVPVTAETRFRHLELDDRPCPPAMEAACGSRRMSDLGINENAGRVVAFEELYESLRGSTGDVVSKLVSLRDASEGDLTVVEACERTSNALVEGTLDASDVEGIRSVFVRGSALERAVARAEELTDVPEGEAARTEEALAVLEEALAPIEQVGAYLDDSSTVYRYFGSIAERIQFNRDMDDHSRTVRLVPDAYFRAHVLCARFLNFLERYDEALEHGRILQRIAPASTDAALVVVRSLEDQSRTYEAADLLVETLKKTATARDAALCHYRLAYMQWKLGRTDLAVACYQRALRWNTDIYDQTRSELDDLLASDPELKRISADEAVEALNAEGIPIGGSRAVSEEIMAAAITCVDNGAFMAARPLLGIEFELVRDDTIINVYRSLLP